MDLTFEIQDGLKEFVGKRMPTVFVYAIVKSYDETTETIIATDTISDLDIFNISLKSVSDSETQAVIIVPKIRSAIIIGSIGDGRKTVLKYSKVDRIKGLIGQMSFDINADGVELKRNGESFTTVMNDFFTELFTSFTAIQGALFLPTNTANYQVLKTRFDKIFK